MPRYTYLILGAGRQGTAAGYDLAIYGSSKKILIGDQDINRAARAAKRINLLTATELAEPLQINLEKEAQLEKLLNACDSMLSAVPYTYNLYLTELAVKTGTHFCDMGGKTDIVWKQLELDEKAKNAGISIVPDCGMGPGLINTMGAYAVQLLDQPRDIYIYDAGLPQNPVPPWNYELTFHINGLTNEMDGQAVFLRNGKIAFVDTLTEPEFQEVPPFGLLEADVTSGGTSTAPWSFQEKLITYENKVYRYPGHFEWLRAYKTLGLFRMDPIEFSGQMIRPRDFYHALLEPNITPDGIPKDVGIIRVIGFGKKENKNSKVQLDLVDYYDEQTGFTAMERLTGWHCSVIMLLQVKKVIAPGAKSLETAVNPAKVLSKLNERGIKVKETVEYLTNNSIN